MTPSEKYVSELCEKSFLPFWSFPNPLGKKGKELCDVLVICDDIIILISVKDISVSNHEDESVNYERWVKNAITNSVKQLYGAERFLKKASAVFLKDRKTIINLPPSDSRKIYRIAIAFGSKDNFPLPTGEFGNGFVSVFDEQSTFVILNELDTITDFVNYLEAKEKFVSNKRILIPREIDFLSIYLQTGFDFGLGVSPNVIASAEGLWEGYVNSEEYRQWRKNKYPSYLWDYFIQKIFEYHIDQDTTSEKRSQFEEALRYMNLESRINRIELSTLFENTAGGKLNARMLQPLEGANHCYVFVPLSKKNWEEKEKELQLRCIVARMLNSKTQNVIGISRGSNGREEVFDICFISISEIDENFVQFAEEIQKKLGYFRNPVRSNSKSFRN